jgi:carbon-monoxide dehydrogenase medium subunit
MQPFDYYKPTTFEEAFRYLTLPDKVVYPFAGATDFIPACRDGLWKADAVVDVKELPGMREIRETPEGLLIGAAVRMNELIRSPLLKGGWSVLAESAAVMGNEQVRNRATLGGNLCTASPGADTPPALLALEAQVVICGPTASRYVPAVSFFKGPRKTVLERGELVTGVLLPPVPKGTVGTYLKLSRRKRGDLAIVGVAAVAYPDGGGYAWKVALGAVAPTPIRAERAEAALAAGYDAAAITAAAQGAFDCCKPIDDIRASAAYRRAMVINITRRAIEDTVARLAAA